MISRELFTVIQAYWESCYVYAPRNLKPFIAAFGPNLLAGVWTPNQTFSNGSGPKGVNNVADRFVVIIWVYPNTCNSGWWWLSCRPCSKIVVFLFANCYRSVRTNPSDHVLSFRGCLSIHTLPPLLSPLSLLGDPFVSIPPRLCVVLLDSCIVFQEPLKFTKSKDCIVPHWSKGW